MPKYSKDDKLKVIKVYESGYGKFYIAKLTNIPSSTIRNWIYKFNNDYSMERKPRKKSYSAEFKLKVIETRWKDKLLFKETLQHSQGNGHIFMKREIILVDK